MIKISEYDYHSKENRFFDYLNSKKINLLYDHDFISNLAKIYKVRFFFATSYNNSGQINGILFFYININFVKKKAFTFYDCLATDDQVILKNIFSEVKFFLKKKKIFSFVINTPKNIDFLESETKSNFIINILPRSIDLNWNNKPSVFRTEVRKAIRRNYNVEKKKIFSIFKYYDLYKINQIRNKASIHNLKFFSNLFYNKANVVFSCYKENLLVGYIVVNINKENAHVLLSNISRKHLSNGINQLLYWEVIKYLCKTSSKNLILGPSKKDGGTAFFKKKIGGEEYSFYQYEIFKSQKIVSGDKKLSIINTFFNYIYNYLPKFIIELILKKKRCYGKVF